MGLCIHYSGTIRRLSLLHQLVAEVIEACKASGWRYELVDASDIYPIQGICFTATGCDTISLTFLSDGRMCSVDNLECDRLYINKDPDESILYILSAHLQGAKAQTRFLLVQLFRRLRKKYFSRFELIDENNYPETKNDEELLQYFEEYEKAMQKLHESFRILRDNPSLSLRDKARQLRRIGRTDKI